MDADQSTRARNWVDTIRNSIEEIGEAGDVACGLTLLGNRNLDSLLGLQNVKKLVSLDTFFAASPRPSVRQVLRLIDRASQKLHLMWSWGDERSGEETWSPKNKREIARACHEVSVALNYMLRTWITQRERSLDTRAAPQEVQLTLGAVKLLNQAMTGFDNIYAKLLREQELFPQQQNLASSPDVTPHLDERRSGTSNEESDARSSPLLHEMVDDQQDRTACFAQGFGKDRDEKNMVQRCDTATVGTKNPVNPALDEADFPRSNVQQQDELNTTDSPTPSLKSTSSEEIEEHTSESSSTASEAVADEIWRPGLGIEAWIIRQQQNARKTAK